MNIKAKTAALTVALALAASPALALPPQAPSNNGTQHAPSGAPSNNTNTPGPHASLPAKAKAYGRYCQSFSKKHVAGTPGTPFSKCVTAMAKLASGDTSSPRHACRNESKKHVDGEKGTAFSRCVVAGAKLLHAQDDSDS
jgi:hypothetical protein